ncbi:MAG: hypothetical protein QM704_12525 [Anaeromyxobacteraceae bacterium]
MRTFVPSLVVSTLLLGGCDSRREPSVAADPVTLEVQGLAQDGSVSAIPGGGAPPSVANGTDFGDWTAGTLGNPIGPKFAMFRVVNVGDHDVVLRGPPFVEVASGETARFALLDVCAATLAPGQAMTFSIGFDGLGEFGPHEATVAVHLASGEDFTFGIRGTSVPTGQH